MPCVAEDLSELKVSWLRGAAWPCELATLLALGHVNGLAVFLGEAAPTRRTARGPTGRAHGTAASPGSRRTRQPLRRLACAGPDRARPRGGRRAGGRPRGMNLVLPLPDVGDGNGESGKLGHGILRGVALTSPSADRVLRTLLTESAIVQALRSETCSRVLQGSGMRDGPIRGRGGCPRLFGGVWRRPVHASDLLLCQKRSGSDQDRTGVVHRVDKVVHGGDAGASLRANRCTKRFAAKRFSGVSRSCNASQAASGEG